MRELEKRYVHATKMDGSDVDLHAFGKHLQAILNKDASKARILYVGKTVDGYEALFESGMGNPTWFEEQK